MFAEKTGGATVDNNTLRLCSVRKVRDSNPRYPKGVYRISSPARSITLPTFLISGSQRTCPFG